jgi:hypothetical protein
METGLSCRGVIKTSITTSPTIVKIVASVSPQLLNTCTASTKMVATRSMIDSVTRSLWVVLKGAIFNHTWLRRVLFPRQF